MRWLGRATRASRHSGRLAGPHFSGKRLIGFYSDNQAACGQALEIAPIHTSRSIANPATKLSGPDFNCKFTEKPNWIALFSIDVLVGNINALAVLAVDNFDAYIPVFRSTNAGILLRYKSAKGSWDSGYQTRSLMWSIRDLSCWMNEKGIWPETNIQCELDSVLLGFGSIWSIPVGSRNETLDASSISQAPNVAKRAAPNAEIKISKLEVVVDGPRFVPFDIYFIFIKILIALAEVDPDEHPTTITVYNRRVDLGFAIGPTSEEASNLLTARYIIAAIADLAQDLANIRNREAQWKQFSFLIDNDGRHIGQGVLKKGRIPSPESNFDVGLA